MPAEVSASVWVATTWVAIVLQLIHQLRTLWIYRGLTSHSVESTQLNAIYSTAYSYFQYDLRTATRCGLRISAESAPSYLRAQTSSPLGSRCLFTNILGFT